MVPVHLLVFGVQAFVTSLTCLADVWAWPDRSVAEKRQITTLYGPYVALGRPIAFHSSIFQLSNHGQVRSWPWIWGPGYVGSSCPRSRTNKIAMVDSTQSYRVH